MSARAVDWILRAPRTFLTKRYRGALLFFGGVLRTMVQDAAASSTKKLDKYIQKRDAARAIFGVSLIAIAILSTLSALPVSSELTFFLTQLTGFYAIWLTGLIISGKLRAATKREALDWLVSLFLYDAAYTGIVSGFDMNRPAQTIGFAWIFALAGFAAVGVATFYDRKHRKLLVTIGQMDELDRLLKSWNQLYETAPQISITCFFKAWLQLPDAQRATIVKWFTLSENGRTMLRRRCRQSATCKTFYDGFSFPKLARPLRLASTTPCFNSP